VVDGTIINPAILASRAWKPWILKLGTAGLERGTSDWRKTERVRGAIPTEVSKSVPFEWVILSLSTIHCKHRRKELRS
jgi:hypothetical protein